MFHDLTRIWSKYFMEYFYKQSLSLSYSAMFMRIMYNID